MSGCAGHAVGQLRSGSWPSCVWALRWCSLFSLAPHCLCQDGQATNGEGQPLCGCCCVWLLANFFCCLCFLVWRLSWIVAPSSCCLPHKRPPLHNPVSQPPLCAHSCMPADSGDTWWLMVHEFHPVKGSIGQRGFVRLHFGQLYRQSARALL